MFWFPLQRIWTKDSPPTDGGLDEYCITSWYVKPFVIFLPCAETLESIHGGKVLTRNDPITVIMGHRCIRGDKRPFLEYGITGRIDGRRRYGAFLWIDIVHLMIHVELFPSSSF
jgi:hypothetical protein